MGKKKSPDREQQVSTPEDATSETRRDIRWVWDILPARRPSSQEWRSYRIEIVDPETGEITYRWQTEEIE